MRIRIFALCSGTAALLLVGVGLADTGSLADERCASCHGDDGVSEEAATPTLAGQSAIYLAETMQAYLDDDRPAAQLTHEDQQTDMKEIVAALSQEELDGLAEYYSELEFRAFEQEFDADLADQGETVHFQYCEKCHEDAGSSPDDDAGLMAGQPMEYLLRELKHYASEKRSMTEKMDKKYRAMLKEEGDGSLEQLAHYYASQQAN